jgi:arsenate reductase
MIVDEREILIYYNPDSNSDLKTVAFAQSITPFVKSYTYQQAPISNLRWEQIFQAIGMPPKELLDKSDPYYQENIRGHEFDDDGWMKILRHNPQLIKAPIAIRGDKVILCQSPKDIYKLTEVEEVEKQV